MSLLTDILNIPLAFLIVPVFFDQALLDEFKKKPYNIEWGTKYLGLIRKNNDWAITFGITPKGFVNISLGDLLQNIEENNDVQVFFRHYIRIDNLGLHYVKNQFDGEFVSDEDPNE